VPPRGTRQDPRAQRRGRGRGAPILVTTATTFLGFATLIFSDITILKQFGWAATLGLTANFAATLLGIPMLLRLWPTPKRIRASAVENQRRARRSRLESPSPAITSCGTASRSSAVFAALAIGSLWGWSTLKVDTDSSATFRRARRSASACSTSIGRWPALPPSSWSWKPDARNGVADPATLKQIASLQQFIESLPGISKTVSIVDYVSQLNASFVGTNAGPRSVPDSRTSCRSNSSSWSGHRRPVHRLVGELGQHRRASQPDRFVGTGVQALRQIDRYVAQNIHGVQVHPTGQSILTNRAADYMAVNEVTSFAWTLAIIGIIHALLFMSVKAGFLSLIPNVTPVIYSFGLMGLLGIPLSTGTALVATIAIGIAGRRHRAQHDGPYSRQLNEHRDERTAVLAHAVHPVYVRSCSSRRRWPAGSSCWCSRGRPDGAAGVPVRLCDDRPP
jgi:predicted RND superfamily exporter protein